ncbi:MAG TPA: flagellar basal-body rod protein FlgG [Planctomycetes bacterium]|nr:flagellar basal-body rod protein FlgG [Planctomycetota bacterium]
MFRAMSTAATGLSAQQYNVDVIANNLANVNTTGFKRRRAEFADLLYVQLRHPGSAASAQEGTVFPTGIQIGHGTRNIATTPVFRMGTFLATDRELDIAIEDRGVARTFLQVRLPGGRTAYTRDGSLQVNANGEIVTTTSYPIEPPITGIPEDYLAIQISTDGLVQVVLRDETVPREIGQIEVASFINPAGLRAYGDNLYLPTEASGIARTGTPGTGEFGSIVSGFLETSNVEAVKELVGLITAQRAYEMNSKVIQSADDMLQVASNLRR